MTSESEKKVSQEEAERVWEHLEAIPGFTQRVHQAIQEIEDGKGVTASEYLRQRSEAAYVQGIGDSGEDQASE